jgi:SAM-dependent methyltransferase
MRVFHSAGLEWLAWSLRRLHCPVGRDALVLEVGSGGNPYPRANVLLDAYEETRERHYEPLVADRPTVPGFVEHLPFRDKVFDFIIASHVLEHSWDPVRFLSELERVGRCGYIECPDAFMERINPYRDHRLEITVSGSKLLIRKKRWWKEDEELVELYEKKAKAIITQETIPRHPFSFHVRYFWQERIDYEVLNPEQSCDWDPPEGEQWERQGYNWRRTLVLILLRHIFSQRRRNRRIRLWDLLACPACRSYPLLNNGTSIDCPACSRSYEVRRGIPILTYRIPREC